MIDLSPLPIDLWKLAVEVEDTSKSVGKIVKRLKSFEDEKIATLGSVIIGEGEAIYCHIVYRSLSNILMIALLRCTERDHIDLIRAAPFKGAHFIIQSWYRGPRTIGVYH